jgi:hypothetical protein
MNYNRAGAEVTHEELQQCGNLFAALVQLNNSREEAD